MQVVAVVPMNRPEEVQGRRRVVWRGWLSAASGGGLYTFWWGIRMAWWAGWLG